MAIDSSESDVRQDEWTRPWWRWTGWLLAAGFLALVLLTLATGQRPATIADLRATMAAGDVSEIRTEGLLPDGATGYSQVTITWDGGLFDHWTTIYDASSPREAQEAGADDPDASPPVVVGLEESLGTTRPDVTIVETGPSLGTYTEALDGWRIPSGVGWLCLAVFLAGLLLVGGGPEPRRANRWACFWMALLSPLGLAAYLVLAGPTGLSRAPADHSRRLRGGWGLVVALLLQQVLPWTSRPWD